jgi:hypothetical protein
MRAVRTSAEKILRHLELARKRNHVIAKTEARYQILEPRNPSNFPLAVRAVPRFWFGNWDTLLAGKYTRGSHLTRRNMQIPEWTEGSLPWRCFEDGGRGTGELCGEVQAEDRILLHLQSDFRFRFQACAHARDFA